MGKISSLGYLENLKIEEDDVNILSIWELPIWYAIAVKIRIILIGISHLCIERKVKSKQNIRKKEIQLRDYCLWKHYQNVTIYSKKFYYSFITVKHYNGYI